MAYWRPGGPQPRRLKTTLGTRHWDGAQTHAERMPKLEAAAVECRGQIGPSCRRRSLREGLIDSRTAISHFRHPHEAAAECHSRIVPRCRGRPREMHSAIRRTRASSSAARDSRCSSTCWPGRPCGRSPAFARRRGPEGKVKTSVVQRCHTARRFTYPVMAERANLSEFTQPVEILL
jgi:hypothetical protein